MAKQKEETSEVKVAEQPNYSFAFNPVKLNQAIAFCRKAGDVSMEAVKARYVALKGLLTEEAEAFKKTRRPRATSNVRE